MHELSGPKSERASTPNDGARREGARRRSPCRRFRLAAGLRPSGRQRRGRESSHPHESRLRRPSRARSRWSRSPRGGAWAKIGAQALVRRVRLRKPEPHRPSPSEWRDPEAFRRRPFRSCLQFLEGPSRRPRLPCRVRSCRACGRGRCPRRCRRANGRRPPASSGS